MDKKKNMRTNGNKSKKMNFRTIVQRPEEEYDIEVRAGKENKDKK